jgi:hypothetical protein
MAPTSRVVIERIDAGHFDGSPRSRAEQRSPRRSSKRWTRTPHSICRRRLQKFIGDGSIDRIGAHADAQVERSAVTP